jgi:VanZ family protein
VFTAKVSQKFFNTHYEIIIIFVSANDGHPNMLRYIFQYKFSILLATLIALLSLVPANNFPIPSIYFIPYIDKLVHITMYAPLGFVALVESRCKPKCHRLYFFILFGILLASAIIEVLQASVIASRGAEWYDLLANFAGLTAGYLAFLLIGDWRIFRFLKY